MTRPASCSTCKFTRFRAPHGDVRGWLGTAHEAQGRADAESAVRRAGVELARVREIHRELLETVSHDMRAPLNAMLGWTRLLKTRSLPGSVIDHALGVLERQIELQADLANELADLAGAPGGPHSGDGGRKKAPGSGRLRRFRGVGDLSDASDLSWTHPDHGDPGGDEESPRQSSISLLRLTVLIVDDDVSELAQIARTLQSAGAEVYSEGSALTALAAIREILPDVLVAKVELPIVDGWTLIRQVRTWAPEHGGSTPALSIARTAEPEHVERSRREGFQEHLSRPVPPDTLIEVVAALVDRPEPE